ncbi:MAG: cytidylate kinase [Candidatus Marinimicrobia bacterium]|nr:cytidylate kinase [Candidatus Neomarinimicrobiota bacterium]|tara:strand:- start:128 stop:775 length:648 start_codon:yes stop_codon:yes gene_type:complete
MIVAIDGPAASGKGTLAQRLANTLNFAYLDTGSLYRAVGLATLRAGDDPSHEPHAVKAAQSIDLNMFYPHELRSEEAGIAASKVAFLPKVRAVLLEFQRSFATNPPPGKSGVIMDGRDIGTVVCPSATAKIFVTADLQVRVDRRVKELRDKGETVIENRVRADMEIRDARDKDRSVSPLTPANDAWILDTSNLDADAAFAQAREFVSAKMLEKSL